MRLPDRFFEERKLEALVENQTTYTVGQAAMHIFETQQQAERVQLQFDHPVIASMLRGKKIMHLRDEQSFDFLPGESLILPANELMQIDFPEAQKGDPTQCLAIAIAEERVREIITLMNETMPKADDQEWNLMDYNFHFTNDAGIYQILQRLIFLFAENHPAKDFFVNNMLQELIMRILQANTKKTYLEFSDGSSGNNRLAYVIQYIRNHLGEPLSIDTLSEKACMSKSHFYRVFKNEVGISPNDFINDERIKWAASMLKDPHRKIKEVYLECGFESRSYFNRLFKRKKQLSPGEFQVRANKQQ
ncbi:MAG: AraC family transcriptional regulator N-terminal domain-containing protein [Cyclobacteriaceae bacterium]